MPRQSFVLEAADVEFTANDGAEQGFIIRIEQVEAFVFHISALRTKRTWRTYRSNRQPGEKMREPHMWQVFSAIRELGHQPQLNRQGGPLVIAPPRHGIRGLRALRYPSGCECGRGTPEAKGKGHSDRPGTTFGPPSGIE